MLNKYKYTSIIIIFKIILIMENCKELESAIQKIIKKSKNFEEYEIEARLKSYFIPDIFMCSKLNQYLSSRCPDTDKFVTQFLTMKSLSNLDLDLSDFDDQTCSCARFKFISVFANTRKIADKLFLEFKELNHYLLGTVR